MNALINWIRNNPLSLVAILVSVASLVVMTWFMIGSGGLRDQLSQQAQAIKKLRSYRAVQVSLPPSKPGEQGYEASGVMVNAQAIEKVEAINQQMDRQSRLVGELALNFNRGTVNNADVRLMFGSVAAGLERRPMRERLFPRTGSDSDAYAAREDYLRAFRDMLGPWSPDGPAWRLDAGNPPSPEEIAARIGEVEADLFQDSDRGQLDEAAIQHEMETKRIALLQLFKEKAESIHVYTAFTPDLMISPFQIGAWAQGTMKPDMLTLWEAQMELWIQQDLVAAIAWANRVWEASSLEGGTGTSVINAPVKRLLGITVIPGYVGTHTAGGMGQTAVINTGGSRSRGGGFMGSSAGMGGRGGQGGGASEHGPTDRNFFVSPTGRLSNSMYDVRHAAITLHVDAKQLPRVFESFSRINFMTVIDCSMQDVDEFGPEGYAGGFYYGDADVIRVDLVIECVFLRQWTTTLMPDEAKAYVGVN
ncbi:hypothetical protein [Mucisphaera calidilacus]|uniref:Uncharacterized protein n=1 Tax=Mucisphaera calidilacus TaxID=2527982 RepID=A0A518BVB4_9BACT|nr:hypothetical protein [Mucisphaera calidilacus]QDU70922.1 hypothetical protein Pan265_07660 [Mucisphaera calidilacus]